ncbi:MAG: hypothetical protein OEN48_17845 [Betaproteobacteria bacterium]|nr:hypothetical protein [Betaproteobacteria bacterium]
MQKIATLLISFLLVGCVATGADLAANLTTTQHSSPDLQGSVAEGATPASLVGNAQHSNASAIAELEQIKTVSTDEIGGGEQAVCRYVLPTGSRIARKQCYIYDPIDEALDEMVTRETVEDMRQQALLRQKAELERTMRGGFGGSTR